MNIVYLVCFCLIYLTVFGAETIKSDESSNRNFGQILVPLLVCRDNGKTSL